MGGWAAGIGSWLCLCTADVAAGIIGTCPPARLPARLLASTGVVSDPLPHLYCLSRLSCLCSTSCSTLTSCLGGPSRRQWWTHATPQSWVSANLAGRRPPRVPHCGRYNRRSGVCTRTTLELALLHSTNARLACAGVLCVFCVQRRTWRALPPKRRCWWMQISSTLGQVRCMLPGC